MQSVRSRSGDGKQISHPQIYASNSDLYFLLELCIGFYFWLHEHFKLKHNFFLGFYTPNASQHFHRIIRGGLGRGPESLQEKRIEPLQDFSD